MVSEIACWSGEMDAGADRPLVRLLIDGSP